MSMITATAWVPRGRASQHPARYEFDEEEYGRISKLAKLELDDANEDLEDARQALSKTKVSSTGDSQAGHTAEENEEQNGAHDALSDDDDLREYDLENYDADEVDGIPEGDPDEEEGSNSIFGNIGGLAYYRDSKEDPYLKLPEQGDASDDEEREELQILPTDNMVLAARIEDEVAHLEVYIYEDDADANLYVHHDVMLPAIPLCVEWLDIRPNNGSDQGNFAAVGTMDPDIELWDLDVVDCMFPTAILGQNSRPATDAPLEPATKKKKRKVKKANASYHVDSVLSLAANRTHRHLLASASADKTTKLWDLNTCTAAHSYTHHTDKVCALAWHPTQASVLLSGSYDRTIVAADMRAPDTTVPRWGVESDVEQVRWDPHDENNFYVSTENGVLHCFDARQLPSSPEKSKAMWRLQAHEKSLSSFSVNPTVPGFIATASVDRTVKLWNITENGPSLVVNRDLGVGKVFSANFAPDDAVAFRLAVAGSKGAVQVWDTSTNRAVREAFAGRMRLQAGAEDVVERVIGIEVDDEEEEEEEEAEENGGEGGWESMEEE
ncbi:rRNA-processing protein [Friedmanniomyces endolithicus]|uniref:rRNA-processing protein n=1 Tax=Friedmanniomyces endolithicus TaxID=329885 RepID=A0AAN6L1B5_9PEZI|nr:rRNA-processing protein [Friedmanniomyces endolithicus]KAK0286042.1 rRNA-processing protein [Friedmanniomyces endolithicus]KAK0309298.1 rRNA-processing protein [Friedmanniomyces endolithicus]KAK0311081.1 rRNA-processing protein [Friedmanniomyces endolithicus]KAK0833048.1 rRNA-processing protein [Friedmanniomyces endolithicus]